MTEPLRDLLDRLADEQPAVQVAPETFARGRRAHRRRTVLRAGAATALVTVALVAIGPVVDDPERAPAPAGSDRAPAMPAELHPVPSRLAPHEEDGYVWHAAVRADDLAVGPTAAVFPVNGGAVVAVSALDGGYRGLDLPGFDESSWFRFEEGSAALSPDGTRLAWTWNPDVISGSVGEPIASGVRIADLATGEVTDVEIPSPYGVYAHGFGWSPDGRYLAYGLDRATDAGGGVSGSRNHGVERLDTATGTATPTPLRGTDSAPAVSNDGTVAVAGGGSNAIWSPRAKPSTVTFDGPFTSVGWSPSGDRTALTTHTGGVALGDRRGVRRESSRPLGVEGRTRVVGWPDGSSFVVLDEAASSLDRVSADLEDTETLVEAEGVADLYQLSVATDLLDRPTWDAPPPDWPTDWGALAWRTALAVGALTVGVALVLSRRRRP